jgi:mRNA interferase MazF
MSSPERGEMWYADLDPVRGHEQAGRRPVLVVSITAFNSGPAGLIVAVPLTKSDRGIPMHVRVDPPEAGLSYPSFVKCEDIRSIDQRRLSRRIGAVSSDTMRAVEFNLMTLLDL